MTRQIDPEAAASALIEHAADTVGEERSKEYLVRAIAEIFGREPGVLAHISRKLITDLAEEVARIAPDRADDVITLLEEVQQMWEQQP